MESISIADAEGRLEEIVGRALGGEPITITRDGKALAVVSGVAQSEASRKRIDVDAMRALTSRMAGHGTSAADFIREMRDDARY